MCSVRRESGRAFLASDFVGLNLQESEGTPYGVKSASDNRRWRSGTASKPSRRRRNSAEKKYAAAQERQAKAHEEMYGHLRGPDDTLRGPEARNSPKPRNSPSLRHQPEATEQPEGTEQS